MNTFLNLLFINLFVVLVHEAGFFETLDTMINERHKFYHLPYIFMCALCQTFWLSILYLIIAGPFNLFTITIALINAHLTKITQPLYKLIENILLKLISKINEWLNLDQ